ncbi:hypothetical protein IPZ68_30635 [Streptomyces arenae]|nr:hypothetical protein [Streptomyces arenae]
MPWPGVYATSAQYETYTGQTAPADIAVRLARASRFLDSEVFRLCGYEVDDDGYPSNLLVKDAFADAVCPAHSRVTLTPGRVTTVVAAYKRDGGLPTPDHFEVQLK